MAALRQDRVAHGGWEDTENGRFDPGLVDDPPVTLQRNGHDRHLVGLVRAVETEVIPRLLLAQRALAARSSSRAAGPASGAPDVTELAGLALRSDAAARSFVEARLAAGTPVESIYLDLLAPTARHLGDLWTADLCDFTEVTIALCRLQQVLREIGTAFRCEAEQPEHGLRILLVPAPGEQHTFGLSMVAEFFRRAGWDVASLPPASRQELLGLVRREWFAVVGLSVGCETRLDALAAGIRAIRRASCNRAVGVMVGGPVFVEHPELVVRVGADATAIDGREATVQAQNLLALLPGHS